MCLCGLRVSCCQVISLPRLTIYSNLHDILGYGWRLVLCVALCILGWHWLFCSHGKNVISYTAWVTLAWLAYVANLLLLINITWLIIMFKRWLVIAASRHESVLLWSLCMFRIRGIRPRWISPVEHSRSSLCSCCFYMHVCRWGCSSFFWWRWRGLSVRGPDWWGLGFLLGLVGVGHPMKLTLF
jgi:hypothetical protein